MLGKKWLKCLVAFSFFLLASCCRPCSSAYHDFYRSVESFCPSQEPMRETPYFLVILTNARHLDYTDNDSFLSTVAKHPRDGSKTGDVGHAWIYLKGSIDGREIIVEGGHSGETGRGQARYFDGIMNYNEWGYANPNLEEKPVFRYEPNPIKYLWASQSNGFFQQGSGGHVPTFAAKIDLTEERFRQLLNFIHPSCYSYQNYQLTGDQCSTFVAKVAELADLQLDCQATIEIKSGLWFRRTWIRFWEDPRYRFLTFGSPDTLEKSLMQAVRDGQADDALNWYLNRRLISNAKNK